MSVIERGNEALKQELEASGAYKETAQSAFVTSTYPISSVAWAGKTKFCSEVVLCTSPTYKRMLATDGELQSSERDEAIYHEHLVHPAVIAYRALYGDKPLRVLVLGAGEGATIRELVKYDRESVQYIMWNDIDEELVQLCDEFLQYVPRDGPYYDLVYNDPERCERRYEDANKLLAEQAEPYDIVISDLPDPVLGDTSSLYGTQFWKNLYQCTAEKCVVSTHTGPIGASAADVATNNWLKEIVQQTGFAKPLSGKASIPSFLTEWGYLVFTKDTPLNKYSGSWGSHLPQSAVVLDEDALTSFYHIPSYYYTM